MADVAGLVIGIVATWSACVQVFDIVDSSKTYGMKYELLRVKLEVERIRLLTWGDAVGLNDVERGFPSRDARFNREDIRRTVLRLLGCIQHIFEHSERLQEIYGLLPMPLDNSDLPDEDEFPTRTQMIFGSIFQRAYKDLRRSARDRQRGTPVRKKTLWAVQDKKKFQAMVSEIRGLNDNLESLFPGAKSRSAVLISNDIDQSVEVQSLQTLQEATADDHVDISETASVRLEALGATITTRSIVPENAHINTEELIAPPQPNGDEAHADAPTGEPETEMDELSKEEMAVDLYVKKKHEGALGLYLIGPDEVSARVTTHVVFNGKTNEFSGSYWHRRGSEFTKTPHASFDLYRRKRFSRKRRHDTYGDNDEDYVLLDVESEPIYESVYPGTVTVEGFGRECWDYELTHGNPRNTTIFVSCAKLPVLEAKTILRRFNELSHGGDNFGWNPNREEGNLQEFGGKISETLGSATRGPTMCLGDLVSLLNRRDVFADFTSMSSISFEWAGLRKNSLGIWNFLWQVIIAKELAMRMEHHPDVSISGFTPKTLASLIVADLWLKNVNIILEDYTVTLADVKKPQSPEEKAKAEGFKFEGNEAMKNKQYQKAVDLYSEAIKIDHSSAVYIANRSAALMMVEKFKDAREDAMIATLLDPNYGKSWARLGIAELKLGNGKKARDAYQRAIEVAGSEITKSMEQGLANANAKNEADTNAIENEPNRAAKDVLRRKYEDQDWDIVGKVPEFHSHVHQQQVEGLLLFAERIKWPYFNEVRYYAEDVYGNLRSGLDIPVHLHDWFYGITLPGAWMSFKIMTALIQCTPSISTEVDAAPYYDCGLSLLRRSYWRVRTVLGRVLGCVPGAISLCGWIGPCPPVEFFPSPAEYQPRHVRLHARRVAPFEYAPKSDDGVTYIGPRHTRFEATKIRPDEEAQSYLAEMKDPDSWVVPEPPVRQVSDCAIHAIQLKKMPLDNMIIPQRAQGGISARQVDALTPYRASIIFKMDNNEDAVTYTLFTNPVFITPPPCLANQAGGSGLHEVHLRELPMYQRNIWTIERLMNHTPEDIDDGVMVINATGQGAEALARAWCSERGKNAIIRRSGGPCYVCAVKAADKAGLGLGVLIWVS